MCEAEGGGDGNREIMGSSDIKQTINCASVVEPGKTLHSNYTLLKYSKVVQLYIMLLLLMLNVKQDFSVRLRSS